MLARRLLLTLTSIMVVSGELAHSAYSPEPMNGTLGKPGTLQTPVSPSLSGLKTDEWYTVSRTISAPLFRSSKNRNINVPANLDRLTMVEGTEFQILKFAENGEYALIGIDEDGFSTENPGVVDSQPVVAWVRTADIAQANAQVVDIESIQMLADLGISFDQDQSEYSRTDTAARKKGQARRRGGQGRGGRRGGMTYCLADVRIWASSKIGASKVPQGIPMASIAYPKYKAKGWRPIAYSASVPVGTACFFKGGRKCGKTSRCGHAAIKIAANKWKGAGVRPTPFLRSNGPGRTPLVLQGCLVMPGR